MTKGMLTNINFALGLALNRLASRAIPPSNHECEQSVDQCDDGHNNGLDRLLNAPFRLIIIILQIVCLREEGSGKKARFLWPAVRAGLLIGAIQSGGLISTESGTHPKKRTNTSIPIHIHSLARFGRAWHCVAPMGPGVCRQGSQTRLGWRE